jgi:tyrosyl-tRNA synthetase
MSFGDVIKLAARITVARCLERDDFARRLAEERPISLHELLYPLMQAYDSVMVHSDVELGGTDQIFNILLGRELQREVGQEPQVAVTNPLLEGLDGSQKMSKSKGNYIGINEPAAEMFGKAMSIPDELMQKYFVLTTDVPLDQVQMYLSGDVHPREAKAELAAAIVRRYHGEQAASEARREFNRVFQQGELPDDMPTVTIPESEKKDGKVWIVKLLRLADCADSNSEARRIIAQGGVSMGESADTLETIKDANTDLEVADGTILKVGKLRYCRLENA